VYYTTSYENISTYRTFSTYIENYRFNANSLTFSALSCILSRVGAGWMHLDYDPLREYCHRKFGARTFILLKVSHKPATIVNDQ